ncbi:MAG TPA: DUF1801 domain-containing protein [Spirochaetia bacterium]|nr:DUF1801 domain-containing protein [Spirochaetia bacterium]
MKLSAAAAIDQYIDQFPAPARRKLQEIRKLVLGLVPEAEERISYRMPCFYLQGVLVYFAAHERHIGFYPTPSGISAFKSELAGYECSKGAVQFPLDKPLPAGLIRKIVNFRRAENVAKAAAVNRGKSGKPSRRRGGAGSAPSRSS